MEGWMHGRVDAWKGGCMEGWMHGRVDAWHLEGASTVIDRVTPRSKSSRNQTGKMPMLR